MNNVPNETLERITVEPIKKGILARRVFKLILARLLSQPIKYRVRQRQPITERHQSSSLKSRLRNSKHKAVLYEIKLIN